MTGTNQLRSAFLNFFKAQDHAILPSASLVPQDDPSLLFVNAGMVPFKNIFAGVTPPPVPRATTAQKVVRAGGKHNDLDNVGYTNRHHTFFEMMGNFSFGDYFKEQAITFAWQFLTREIGLNPKKLLVTVYAEDTEARALWKKIAGLPDDKIISIPTDDNFWRMGDTGPCGPCSEIFYDHGPDVQGGPPGSPEEDGPRFTEIWNIVFMQFFEEPGKPRRNLGAPFIDTGLGLERFAALLQGKNDNYDTDQFVRLISAGSELLNVAPYGDYKHSLRILADHIRSTAFLIADGVQPEREGRGYVLRRIMRRAIRHIHQTGVKEPVFYKLFPTLLSEMGDAYPELNTHRHTIEHVIKTEEERFSDLLSRGMHLLDGELDRLGSVKTLPGEVAFQLYDTYGFPLDLTQDVLREKNMDVDLDGFENAMAQQKERARASWNGNVAAKSQDILGLTAKHGETEFSGYEAHSAQATIQGLYRDGEERVEIENGQEGIFVLKATPFYAESGGQEGDRGFLKTDDGALIEITDTTKTAQGTFLHHGKVVQGSVKVGAQITAEIDRERRKNVSSHHTATHLLNEALREILGPQIQQKGSLNSADRLRFDLNHPQPVTPQELTEIENAVNAQIRANHQVRTSIMTPDEARKMGAQALFGEKYGNLARVVMVGDEKADKKAWSIELCGGTHVKNLGEIGHVRILSETGVAGGVRRIEAAVGEAADKFVQTQADLLGEIARHVKSAAQDVPARLEQILKERKELTQQLNQLRQKIALASDAGTLEADENGVKIAVRQIDDTPAKQLRTIVQELLKQSNAQVAAVIGTTDGKASIIVACDATKADAPSLVKQASKDLGGAGQGGGKKDFAQAGCERNDPKALLESLKSSISA